MNKVVVVTGASGGIGKALIRHLSDAGYRVVGLSRRIPEHPPADYRHYEVDLTDAQSIEKVIMEVRMDFPALYGLIHNAGVAVMNHLVTLPAEDVQRVFAVNVLAPVYLTRHLVRPLMRNGRGRIVAVSSVVVPWALEGESIYAASKAALEKFIQTIARELAPFHITANVIGLPPLKTELTQRVPIEKMEALLQRTAIRRYLQPEEIFPVLDMLLDERNDAITGQSIYLGGP